MKLAQDCDKTILKLLNDNGVIANTTSKGLLAVDRDSCHNASFAKSLHEFDILDEILKQIRGVVNQELFYVCWGGKTDNDWFLEVHRLK